MNPFDRCGVRASAVLDLWLMATKDAKHIEKTASHMKT